MLISLYCTAQCNSLLTDTTSTDIITVISNTTQALQGHNITFSCFGNDSLQYNSVCSKGGIWDPDPNEVCKGKNFVFCAINLLVNNHCLIIANDKSPGYEFGSNNIMSYTYAVTYQCTLSYVFTCKVLCFLLKYRNVTMDTSSTD